jgi:integrase
VFPSPRTGKRLSSTAHQKPWENVKRLGGVPDHLVFYSLRHNFISTMLTLGVSIFEVARMVGHKSTKMIEESYGHLCPAAAATAMHAFGAAITKKTPGNGGKKAKRV